jgi:hypothetical protein
LSVTTGRNLGSVVNTITKSGTNNLHGSLHEYIRNNVVDADNPLSAPGFDTLRVNQFGANVGGPIRSVAGRVTAVPARLHPAKVFQPEQASLEVESQLGGGWVLTAGYQYVHAIDPPVYYNVNGLPNGNLPDGRQAFKPADPAFGLRSLPRPPASPSTTGAS